ncbi:MAG: hypothetical protein A2Y40_01450 [Candidatus Margulisbacteria bacterium GWF2_35_9]|nr:MAG: hypothetical protein A2Y40_01450 [Candidatus Margulisbacteria bacterium GWF2_35_9]
MSKITVSVIIIHYNTPDLLNNCINSIRLFTKDIHYEIIVVDNHSSIKPALAEIKDLLFIQNEENQGFAKANNKGAIHAKGQFLFLLNSDTVLRDNVIYDCWFHFKYTHKIGALGPRLLNEDGRIQYYGSILGRHQYKGTEARKVTFLSGAALMIPKDIYLKIGGFDEHYFFYNEDLDLCKTLRKKGYDLIYFPKAEVIHFGGKSTVRNSALKIQAYKSSWYYLKKHYLNKLFKK